MLRDAISVLCGSDRFDPVLFFTPPDGRPELMETVPPTLTLIPQKGGDLGERMGRAVDELLGSHVRGAAIVVGSDVPSLNTQDVADAATALCSGSDVVLGPAEDGGYYLIGMTVRRPELFSEISWGSPAVLSQTLARTHELGITPRMLRTTYDLDTIDDLRRVEHDIEMSPCAVGHHLRAWFSARAQ
jgi:uncharacterized protein